MLRHASRHLSKYQNLEMGKISNRIGVGCDPESLYFNYYFGTWGILSFLCLLIPFDPVWTFPLPYSQGQLLAPFSLIITLSLSRWRLVSVISQSVARDGEMLTNQSSDLPSPVILHLSLSDHFLFAQQDINKRIKIHIIHIFCNLFYFSYVLIILITFKYT